MDIVFMDGGLGNQAFQYIFARYLEIAKNTRVFIDDMYFSLHKDTIRKNIEGKPANSIDKSVHNGYEIEYVFPNASKTLLLSEYFGADVWEYMTSVAKESALKDLSVPRQLIKKGMDLSLLFEAVDVTNLSGLTCPLLNTPGNLYNSAVALLRENIYFYGYWLNPGWITRYKNIILKDLSFRPIEDELNKQYESEIRRSFSIGVHIRRGDFVRFQWVLPESYYHSTLTQLSKILPNAKFFIFSDDLEWCKENMKQLGILKKSAIFVEGNYDYKNNYIDVQLMAMCNVLVVGRSSFSYLASMLNQTPGFYAIQFRNPPIEDLAGGIKKVILHDRRVNN